MMRFLVRLAALAETQAVDDGRLAALTDGKR
jgi:hypothetical protein